MAHAKFSVFSSAGPEFAHSFLQLGCGTPVLGIPIRVRNFNVKYLRFQSNVVEKAPSGSAAVAAGHFNVPFFFSPGLMARAQPQPQPPNPQIRRPRDRGVWRGGLLPPR